MAKRPWRTDFFSQLAEVTAGDPIRFELAGGETAQGTVRHTEFREGRLIYITGDLTRPESGRFFFQRQTEPGLAGSDAGAIEFPGSQRGFRIEPSGTNGAPELVAMPLGQIICLSLPAPDTGSAAEEPALNPSDYPDTSVPSYQNGIVSLQSLPGATAVLYIDYRGGYTATWGGITYAKPSVTNAQIRDVWLRVAEDFLPFSINVTTDIMVYQAAPETSRQRVICTPTTTAAPGAGGVAYLNSWNWSGDTPCWSFYSTGKNAAEVIAHEAGHTLSLSHDGRTTPAEAYFAGQGSGTVGWAPIMGVGYYQPVTQWSRGEYTNANNQEDDLARIVSRNNSVSYRTDDAGATTDTARILEIASGGAAFAEGVIETSGDVDAFRFYTAGGNISLRADPAPGGWANLALQASLHDAAGNLIAVNNVQSQLWSSLSTTLAGGTYSIRIAGVGRNSAASTGFSNYASLGYYSVTGTVQNAATHAESAVVAQADFDRDGKPDLVWRNLNSGVVTAWLLNNTTTLGTQVLWPATNVGDAAWAPVATGDFNADGKPDMVWRNTTSGRVIVWFMDGLTTTGTAVIWPVTNAGDSLWVPMAAGDFNGDGKTDLVWRNSSTGRVIVWYMNGVTTTGTAVIWTASNPGDSAWVPLVAGDFNADARPDLVWRNATSGRVVVWLMNGVTTTGTTAIWTATNPGDSAWLPQAAGDFNADGKTDLVWRNTTTGRVIVWLMDGVTRTGTTAL